MTRDTRFRQCTLEMQLQDDARVSSVSWLPEQYAVVNRIVSLRSDRGDWEHGWVVAAVGAAAEAHQLPDWRRDIRNHRRATGDSLPRESDS